MAEITVTENGRVVLVDGNQRADMSPAEAQAKGRRIRDYGDALIRAGVEASAIKRPDTETTAIAARRETVEGIGGGE